jgi:hypothetical protein
MAIDDSFDAVESQYPEKKGGLSAELATMVGALTVPKASFLFEALRVALKAL